MKLATLLQDKRAYLIDTARRHGAGNVRVFGSAARGAETEGSDLDLLVDVGETTSLLDLVKLQLELEDALGVPVDVVTADDLPATIRGQVVSSARPI
jgi:predicted nucleotidyltransferase